MIYDGIYEEASALHLGAAAAHGKGALILESTLHVAKEYIECLRPCMDAPAHGKFSQAFRAQLEALDAIHNGRIHPHGAEHILIRETGKSGAEILFLTRILSVCKKNGIYHVEALCLDTIKIFLCRRFYPAEKSTHTAFHALVRIYDREKLPGDVSVYHTIYESLCILSIEAQNLQSARKRFAAMQGIVSVFLTVLLAYPLSKRNLPYSGFFTIIVMLTMYFSPGLIPSFFVVKGLGLTDNFLVYIIPGAINAYNMMLMRNFIQALPSDLEDAARIDGCSNFGILFRVIMPLSKAMLATLLLFVAVNQWNAFMG